MPRKKRSRFPLYILIAFLVLGVGAITVQGIPQCKQLIRTFVDKKVPNRVSGQTLAAWAAWGKSHPDFKPHKRPKYKKTREEVIKQVDFACEVPTVPVEIAEQELPDLPVLDIPAPLFTITEPTPPNVVQIATNQPPLTFVPPFTAGIPPTDVAPVPEPSTLALGLTGGLFLVMMCGTSKSWKRATA